MIRHHSLSQTAAVRAFPSILRNGVCAMLMGILVAQPCAALGQSATAPGTSRPAFITIPKGTLITMTVTQPLSSATATDGQTVQLATDSDLIVGGVIAIPRGTAATGVVEHVMRAVPGKINGDLAIKPTAIHLANGTWLPLRKYPPGEDACAEMGPCWLTNTLFFPITLIALAAQASERRENPDAGKDLVWDKTMMAFGYTHRKVTLSATGLAVADR
jgi:hypothetical protein